MIVRLTILAALVLVACRGGAADGAPTGNGGAVGQERVEVQTTRVYSLGNISVGIGNTGPGSYHDADGHVVQGATITLSPSGPTDHEAKLVVGAGSRFDLGGASWRVVEVHGRGATLERTSP